MDLDEFVAFATGFGSSTHHTQSPNRNLTPITTQPDLTSSSHPIHYPIHVPTKTLHLFIYPSAHLYTPTYPYTLTRLIVNKLLTLYISIDILTFMWYNKDNGEGPFYMLNI